MGSPFFGALISGLGHSVGEHLKQKKLMEIQKTNEANSDYSKFLMGIAHDAFAAGNVDAGSQIAGISHEVSALAPGAKIKPEHGMNNVLQLLKPHAQADVAAQQQAKQQEQAQAQQDINPQAAAQTMALPPPPQAAAMQTQLPGPPTGLGGQEAPPDISVNQFTAPVVQNANPSAPGAAAAATTPNLQPPPGSASSRPLVYPTVQQTQDLDVAKAQRIADITQSTAAKYKQQTKQAELDAHIAEKNKIFSLLSPEEQKALSPRDKLAFYSNKNMTTVRELNIPGMVTGAMAEQMGVIPAGSSSPGDAFRLIKNTGTGKVTAIPQAVPVDKRVQLIPGTNGEYGYGLFSKQGDFLGYAADEENEIQKAIPPRSVMDQVNERSGSSYQDDNGNTIQNSKNVRRFVIRGAPSGFPAKLPDSPATAAGAPSTPTAPTVVTPRAQNTSTPRVMTSPNIPADDPRAIAAEMDKNPQMVTDAIEQMYGNKAMGIPPGRGGPAIRYQNKLNIFKNYIYKTTGMTPQDVVAAKPEVKAQIASLVKTTQMSGVIDMLENTLKNNADLAQKLSDKYDRTKIPLVNRLKMAIDKHTGDEDVLNLAGQMHVVANEWAKLTTGSLGAQAVSVQEAQNLNKLLDASMTPGQLSSFLKTVVMGDAKSRSAGAKETKNKLLASINELRGLGPKKTSLESPPKPTIIIRSITRE